MQSPIIFSCNVIYININTNDTMIYINRDTSIHERVQIKKCNSYSLICKKRMFLESYIFSHAFPQGKMMIKVSNILTLQCSSTHIHSRHNSYSKRFLLKKGNETLTECPTVWRI